MPQISERGKAMPPSPIRKLTPYANSAKERGVTVFHLNIGQPDIETPNEILNAVKNTDLKVLAYSPSEGFQSYRNALSDYYKRNNINVESDEIIVTTGGSEAISFAMLSCLNPGDEIIIPEPFYANYNGFAQIAGIKVVPITSYIEDEFALPKIEDFEKSINKKTKAIMICNPNNPTGYLYSLEELLVLRDLCLKHDLFLFSDEAYREFCYDGAKHISVMSLSGLENHAILLDTVSKRYSACGARIGAMISHNKEVLQTALKFAQARLSPPTLAQILSEAACKLPEDYFEEVLEEYKNRRNLLVKRLQSMPNVICPNPKGAFYVIAKLPVNNAEHFCQWLLSSFSYKGATLMMAPARGFYSSANLGNSEIRLAYVLDEEKINTAMDCLEEALKVYKD